MRYMLPMLVLLLAGCSATGSQISAALDAANKCQGKAKLDIEVSDNLRTARFTCEWEAVADDHS